MTSSINTLIKNGYAKIVLEEARRYDYKGSTNYKKVTLTKEQEKLWKELQKTN